MIAECELYRNNRSFQEKMLEISSIYFFYLKMHFEIVNTFKIIRKEEVLMLNEVKKKCSINLSSQANFCWASPMEPWP